MTLLGYAAQVADFRDKVKALSNVHVPVWHIERIGEFVAFAIRELSPLQVNDVAELVKTPEIGDDSGWRCSKHFLVAGHRGIVEVDWCDGVWWVMWQPENQTWISSQDGKERPVDRPGHYMMPAAWLAVSK